MIQSGASDQPVTVATSPSTVISRPVRGIVSDITDGSQAAVQGTWSDRSLAATQVGPPSVATGTVVNGEETPMAADRSARV